MQKVELVADGDVISYMFKGTPLGKAYSDLIGSRLTGITLLAVSESRQGAVYRNWGMKKLQELDAFLSERVPGLRVLTLHEHWEVREEASGVRDGGPLWLGECDFGPHRVDTPLLSRSAMQIR